MTIVITGMGVSTPLGDGLAHNWNALTTPDALAKPMRKNLSEKGFESAWILAKTATQEALTHAGGPKGAIDPLRLGCTVSVSKPLLESDDIVAPEAVQDRLCSEFGFGGERRNVVAACATGAYSIALAASWIEAGECDVVVAGSIEPEPHPLMRAGFERMGVLSLEKVARPFDIHRSGFVMGGGAGIVILESETHAARRGAKILAQLSGWGLGADGHSSVAFNSNGQRIAAVIGRTLARAGLATRDVRHVNAHGTATRLNDRVEAQALRQAFGSQAPNLMVSATKASTGHLLGAAGSVEFVLTVLALQNQFIPPTATLENPDPECLLDYTPRRGHAAAFHHALSLSFGFGGPIGALLVSL